MNFGVVVLNYLAYLETVECVESFLKQDFHGHRVEIVIVDNASPNESYDFLKTQFKSTSNVRVIRCKKNKGFARGNNLGYRVLKKCMIPDFLIVSNNDIILKQPGIVDWIVSSYDKYRFGVLGPRVYSVRGGFYQSPMDNMTESLIECKIKLMCSLFSIQKTRLKGMLRIPIRAQGIGKTDAKFANSVTKNLTLHGSFQVFSKDYFQYYDKPYDNRTFMYMEEFILKLRCDKRSITMLYNPDYEVNHLQAVATSMASTDEYDRVLRCQKNGYESLKVYYQILKALQG